MDKADEALAILKEQMKNVKLEYDSLSNQKPEMIEKRKQLEQTAAQIKANYLKIAEVRRTNFTKINPTSQGQPHPPAAGEAKMTNSPSLPAQFNPAQVFEAPTPLTGATTCKVTTAGPVTTTAATTTVTTGKRFNNFGIITIGEHRRAISDPTSIETIINFQKSIGD